jgi:hypothetical protein
MDKFEVKIRSEIAIRLVGDYEFSLENALKVVGLSDDGTATPPLAAPAEESSSADAAPVKRKRGWPLGKKRKKKKKA